MFTLSLEACVFGCLSLYDVNHLVVLQSELARAGPLGRKINRMLLAQPL